MEKKRHDLIIGVGNTLLGDDAVGIHIMRKMDKNNIFPGAEYLDMGTSSMELGHYIDNNTRKMVIIDSIRSDEEPGTVFRLKPGDLVPKGEQDYSLHQLKLIDTLKLISLEMDFPETIIVGIVPDDVDTFSEKLSPELEEKFPGIYSSVIKLISEFLEN